MIAVQLDFFKTEEQCEIAALRMEVERQKESLNKQRKKLFAENGRLTKEIIDLRERLEILERGICQGLLTK